MINKPTTNSRKPEECEERLKQLFQLPETSSGPLQFDDQFTQSVMVNIHRGIWIRNLISVCSIFLFAIIFLSQVLPLFESLNGFLLSELATLSLLPPLPPLPNILPISSIELPGFPSPSATFYLIGAIVLGFLFPALLDSLEKS